MNHSATFPFLSILFISGTTLARSPPRLREKVLPVMPSLPSSRRPTLRVREATLLIERGGTGGPRGWPNEREPPRLAHLRTRGFSLKSLISFLNMASFSLSARKAQADVPLSMALRNGAPCPLPCRCPIPIKREREGAIEYNLWTYIGY